MSAPTLNPVRDGMSGTPTPSEEVNAIGSTTSLKRKRTNVGKACEPCRRRSVLRHSPILQPAHQALCRRCKCDGVQPSCTTCTVYKVSSHYPLNRSKQAECLIQDDCYWEAREDYRKPLSRQEVQALTKRLQHAEMLLERHGIRLSPERKLQGGTGGNRDGTQEPVDKDKAGGSGAGDAREWSQDHIVCSGLI
jgi:hypothetical protein